jgi:hypothetical protein
MTFKEKFYKATAFVSLTTILFHTSLAGNVQSGGKQGGIAGFDLTPLATQLIKGYLTQQRSEWNLFTGNEYQPKSFSFLPNQRIAIIFPGFLEKPKHSEELGKSLLNTCTIDIAGKSSQYYNAIWVYHFDPLATIEQAAQNAYSALKDTFGNAEVDLYAHSIGGMIARYYLEKLGAGEHHHHLVMTGVPNAGLPKKELEIYIQSELENIQNLGPLLKSVNATEIIFKAAPAISQVIQGSDFLKHLNSSKSPYFNSLDYYTLAGTDYSSFSTSISADTGTRAQSIYQQSNPEAICDGVVEKGSVHNQELVQISEKWSELKQQYDLPLNHNFLRGTTEKKQHKILMDTIQSIIYGWSADKSLTKLQTLSIDSNNVLIDPSFVLTQKELLPESEIALATSDNYAYLTVQKSQPIAVGKTVLYLNKLKAPYAEGLSIQRSRDLMTSGSNCYILSNNLESMLMGRSYKSKVSKSSYGEPLTYSVLSTLNGMDYNNYELKVAPLGQYSIPKLSSKPEAQNQPLLKVVQYNDGTISHQLVGFTTSIEKESYLALPLGQSNDDIDKAVLTQSLLP